MIVVSIFLVSWHHYTHRYVPGKITFQQYEPSYWPAGLDIKEKVINALYVPSQEPAHYTQLVLEMSDGSVISETERRGQSIAYQCSQGNITNQSCKSGRTDKGEPYLLFTSAFESGALDQFVEWSRQDTDIHINFGNPPKNGYTEEEIEKIIKSFTPVEYQNLEIRHIDRSVI